MCSFWFSILCGLFSHGAETALRGDGLFTSIDYRDFVCGHEFQPIAVIYNRAIALNVVVIVVIIIMVIVVVGIIVVILPPVQSYYSHDRAAVRKGEKRNIMLGARPAVLMTSCRTRDFVEEERNECPIGRLYIHVCAVRDR